MKGTVNTIVTREFPLPRTAPPMTTAHRVEGDLYLIDVEHDPRQSYSRAVQPRAMKEARGHATALIDMRHNDDPTLAPGTLTHRTVTTYVFTRR